MPWLKVHDGLPFDPKVLSLGRNKAEINEAIGMALRLWAWCAQQRTDGFVPASVVEAVGTPTCLKRLTRPAFGRRPFLHVPGEKCECAKDRAYPGEDVFLVHDYLERNPSRDENDVERAKKRERMDPALKAAVRRRDGDRCRYCGVAVNFNDHRSERGGELDHVDPKLAAGADNLVVACKACNKKKAKKTPEQAGMRLLKPAGIDGTQRGPDGLSMGPPASDRGSDPIPIADRTADPPAGREPGKEPAPNGGAVPAAVLAAFEGASVVTTQAQTRRPRSEGLGRDGPGSGSRGGSAGYAGPEGERPTIGPPTTPRGQLDENPYLREYPSPAHYAGEPPVQDPDSSERRPPWA